MSTLNDSNILHQSLVSVNPGDSLSLVIPPTTLFPSLANIHEESLSINFNHLDALNNIVTEQSISSSMEPKETFMCSSSNFPSDDDGDMPTIKSIQSIKDVTAYTGAEVYQWFSVESRKGASIDAIFIQGGVDHDPPIPDRSGDLSETCEYVIW